MARSIEDGIQKSIFTYVSLQYPEYKGLFFHVPNGGKRNAIEAAKFKKMGVVPGIPDFLLIHNSQLYGIELKSIDGTLSKHQKEINELWRKRGINTYVCYGFDDAIKTINSIICGRNIETAINHKKV